MHGAPDGYIEADVERIGGGPLDDDPRNPFARDYDRLIYTRAFRRLQGKTQVVSPGEGDLFRTRLTHTIEVAQAARRLAEHLNRRAGAERERKGRKVGWRPDDKSVSSIPAKQQLIDPSLCEAAAILHDLGHPPYGHAGEEALHDAIVDLTRKRGKNDRQEWAGTTPAGFNGNAQSFRLAVSTLRHRAVSPGLQLTRATLDASLKYPWRYGAPGVPGSSKRWNVDASQHAAFLELRSDVPEELRGQQTVEAQIMDWADDMSYATNDADDWFRAGYMPLGLLVNDAEYRQSYVADVVDGMMSDHDGDPERLERRRRKLRGIAEAFFTDDLGPCVLFQGANRGDPVHDPGSGEAAEAFKFLRGWLFSRFVEGVSIRRRADTPADAPRRYALELHRPLELRVWNALLKHLLWVYVVGDHRMATQQYGQQRIATELFDVHARAVLGRTAKGETLFPEQQRALLHSAGDEDARLAVVVDYISGMTDAYAQTRHRRLLLGEGRLHELPS